MKVEAAKPAASVSGTDYEGVYDGKEHGSAAVPSVIEGTTVEYSTDGGKTWSADVPTVKDVGEVNVKVRATNPNYKEATCEYTLKVTPAQVTVTANAASKAYGEADPAFTAEVSGTVEGESDLISYTVSRTNVGMNDAGKYEAVIVPTGETIQGNYSVSYVPADFTITNSGEKKPEEKKSEDNKKSGEKKSATPKTGDALLASEAIVAIAGTGVLGVVASRIRRKK